MAEKTPGRLYGAELAAYIPAGASVRFHSSASTDFESEMQYVHEADGTLVGQVKTWTTYDNFDENWSYDSYRGETLAKAEVLKGTWEFTYEHYKVTFTEGLVETLYFEIHPAGWREAFVPLSINRLKNNRFGWHSISRA